VDAFAAFYRLEERRRAADSVWRRVDMIALPTAPTLYTVEQVLADPIALNSRLGALNRFWVALPPTDHVLNGAVMLLVRPPVVSCASVYSLPTLAFALICGR